MKITYDKNADAKFIQLKNTAVHSTTQENEWLIFDRDKKGDVIGIEILNSSQHPFGIVSVLGKLVSWFENEQNSTAKIPNLASDNVIEANTELVFQ